MTASALHLSETSAAVFVAVEGKGTRRQSEMVRSTFDRSIKADATRKFIITLDRCDYLDSTFLGSLVQMSRRPGGRPDSPLEIVANEATAEKLFSACKLRDYLPICEVPSSELPVHWRVLNSDANNEDCAYHQLDAHEQLADLDIPEADAFRRVAESMRRELRARDT